MISTGPRGEMVKRRVRMGYRLSEFDKRVVRVFKDPRLYSHTKNIYIVFSLELLRQPRKLLQIRTYNAPQANWLHHPKVAAPST